ncbi:MAG: HesA/MoeB/ThiF family protein [Deltaproteobacteria bacterium]|nr:HesA/MoeB/ThiF family protein [Deltaproteobacteria bacterium]MCB9786744.1 HesA/MoeB/ThiF family protein [Deltaproteobacteria bacterium]
MAVHGDKSALIVGAGGLGCPVAVALAEAGVGHLVLVDGDRVEPSNLQRQTLFWPADVGRAKVEAARDRLAARAPQLRITAVAERASPARLDAMLGGVDVAIDATDDPGFGFLLNDRALSLGVPAVLGGVVRFEGLVLPVAPGHGGCWRCLFEDEPAPHEVASCGDAGVLGAMAGVVGHLQAASALDLLAGSRHEVGVVTTIDGLRGRVRRVRVPPSEHCPACHGAARASAPPRESASCS